MDLDLKDRKILFELDMDARQPLSDLAKKVGLSKQVVSYRINNLVKSNVIEGFYAIVNIAKLGYMYCRLFFKLQNASAEKQKEIIEYGSNHPKIGWIAEFEGDWDLAMVVWAKDIIEIREMIDEIDSKFGEYFQKKYSSIATHVYHFQHKFLLDKKDSKELVLGGKIEQPNIDELDYKIIGILTRDGRASLLEIAEKLAASPKVIAYRIKNLMKAKIILGFRAKINHKLLGYTHYKIFMMLKNTTKEKISGLQTYIRTNPYAIYITRAIGKADFEFEAMTKTTQEFHDLMKDMRFRFADLIKDFQTSIIYNEPQINYLPMEKEMK